MYKNSVYLLSLAVVAFMEGCSSSAVQKNSTAVEQTVPLEQEQSDSTSVLIKDENPSKELLPTSYKDIQYPEFKYVAPYPKDYRVEIAEGIVGYIVSDHSLPLVDFAVYFENKRTPSMIADEAAFEMVGTMYRRGGGAGLTPQVIDDSLEYISAGLSSFAGTFISGFEINSLSKDFSSMLNLAQKIFMNPGFDKEQLEIVKANFVTAYGQRYDNPAKVLSALRSKVNYVPNSRHWDATLDEYKKVSVDDLKRLSKNTFKSKRVVFALSGDVDRDSAVVMLKDFFALWKLDSLDGGATPYVNPQPLSFANKPGIYVVDKDVAQANIAMNQPFVKRPHPDYYPAAVASFILGGGSFSSRLMNRVRSDNGLAYHISSSVGNDYRDTAMTTIGLQTKVESTELALKLIFEEIEKLAKDGPTEDELALAKKSLIESLPSLFDSPSSTASIFASGELLGKTDDHYLDYVKEINAVTAAQVKEMVAKYFDKEKMTISIVAPVSKIESLKPFTVIPQDSLDIR